MICITECIITCSKPTHGKVLQCSEKIQLTHIGHEQACEKQSNAWRCHRASDAVLNELNLYPFSTLHRGDFTWLANQNEHPIMETVHTRSSPHYLGTVTTTWLNFTLDLGEKLIKYISHILLHKEYWWLIKVHLTQCQPFLRLSAVWSTAIDMIGNISTLKCLKMTRPFVLHFLQLCRGDRVWL